MIGKRSFVMILSVASIFFILGTMVNVRVAADPPTPFDRIQKYLTEVIKPKLDIISGQTGALNWTDVADLKNQVADVEGLLTDEEYGLALLARLDAEMQEIWDKLLTIEGKLDTLTNGVNGWFGSIDNKLSNIQNKLDSIEQKADSDLKWVFSVSGDIIETHNGKKMFLRIETNATCQLTLTLWGKMSTTDANIEVFGERSSFGWIGMAPLALFEGSYWHTDNFAQSMTYTSDFTQIQLKNQDWPMGVAFHLIAIGPPNTVITDLQTDYPANVTLTQPYT